MPMGFPLLYTTPNGSSCKFSVNKFLFLTFSVFKFKVFSIAADRLRNLL